MEQQTNETTQMDLNGRTEKVLELGGEIKKEPNAEYMPTFGEKLVGITFNPSNNEKVDRIKRLCAELADIVHEHRGDREWISLQHHLYINTIGEILNAQMNAVKLITFKY